MQEDAMKSIISALMALSVLGPVAVPGRALDARAFYDRSDQQSR
jgi:hypothetical protein